MTMKERLHGRNGQPTAALVVLCIAGLLLTACGGPADQRSDSAKPESTAKTDPTPTSTPSPEPTVSPPPEEPPPEAPPQAPAPQAPPPQAPPPQAPPPQAPPPPPEHGNPVPSPVKIPQFHAAIGANWPFIEPFVRSGIDEACGGLGPACVDYVAIVEFDARFANDGDDCPITEIRIPEPTYDIDVPETPYRDDLITIVINEPCDGVTVPPPAPPAAESG